MTTYDHNLELRAELAVSVDAAELAAERRGRSCIRRNHQLRAAPLRAA